MSLHFSGLVRQVCGFDFSFSPHAEPLIAGALLGGIFAAIFSELIWWPWTYWAQGMILFAYTATSFLILRRDELELNNEAQNQHSTS